MKIICLEILEIVKDFYDMRKGVKKQLILINGVPFLIGVCSFFIGTFCKKNWSVNISDFSSDFLNQLITVLALFISFSIGYIGMLITSDSESVKIMKQKESNYYCIHGEKVKVYQEIHNLMTYTVFVEILFIIFVFAQKFFLYIMNEVVLKIGLCINISILMHIVILIMIQMRDIYFSFWSAKVK